MNAGWLAIWGIAGGATLFDVLLNTSLTNRSDDKSSCWRRKDKERNECWVRNR